MRNAKIVGGKVNGADVILNPGDLNNGTDTNGGLRIGGGYNANIFQDCIYCYYVFRLPCRGDNFVYP